MSKEIAELLKENCVGFFGEARTDHRDPTFGFDQREDASRLLYFTSPDMNFNKWFRFMLPKPLRFWVRQDQSAVHEMGSAGLSVSHYPINMRRFERNCNDYADIENLDDFLQRFKERFPHPALIHTNIMGESHLLGNVDITQQAVDYFKQAPENALNVMREVIGEEIGWVDRYMGIWRERNQGILNVNIYDLVGKPKEAHFKL